jgi:hypothetical protein
MSRQLSFRPNLFRPSTPDWERRVKDLGHHRVNLKKPTKEGCGLAAKPADIPLWSGNPDNPQAQNIADVTYGDGGADYIPPYFFIDDPKRQKFDAWTQAKMEERDINLLVAELGECHRLIDTMVKGTERFQRLGADLVSAFEQAKSVQLKLQTNVPKTKKLLAALTLCGDIHAEIKEKYLVKMGVKDVFAPDDPHRYDDGGAKASSSSSSSASSVPPPPAMPEAPVRRPRRVSAVLGKERSPNFVDPDEVDMTPLDTQADEAHVGEFEDDKTPPGAKKDESQAIASAERLAREAADSDEDSDYKPTPAELKLSQELLSSSSSSEEEEEDEGAGDEVDWAKEQAELGISPSEPPAKKAKLSAAAAKRQELESKLKREEGEASKPASGAAGAGAGGGGGAVAGAGVGSSRALAYMGRMTEKVKQFFPKVHWDLSLVPSHMADEHRLRPGLAPKYDKLSREQLVAEMQALGWKVKTKATKKEMVEHLGKAWGAWRYRLKQFQQAKMAVAARDAEDKVGVNAPW